VFYIASAFNGDLSQWNVAKVNFMIGSKSIRTLVNELTRHELMLLCDWRVQSGVWVCD
jgi:hypothetical protein